MHYSDFLQCHSKLNESSASQQWNGSIYLPPCTCYSARQLTCSKSTNNLPIDFKKHTDIDTTTLIDLCKYTKDNDQSLPKQHLLLCKKYSLCKNKINFEDFSILS